MKISIPLQTAILILISSCVWAVRVHKLPQMDQPYGKALKRDYNAPRIESLLFAKDLNTASAAAADRSQDSTVAIVKHCSGYFPAIFTLFESKLKPHITTDPVGIKYELNFISNNYNTGTVIRECLEAHREISKMYPVLGERHHNQIDAFHSLLDEYRRSQSPRSRANDTQAQQSFDQKLQKFLDQPSIF